jgi:hypothetical protein
VCLQEYYSDGRVDKSAHKWAVVADGLIPKEGDANAWHEKWGERWDGQGRAIKFTDRWKQSLC